MDRHPAGHAELGPVFVNEHVRGSQRIALALGGAQPVLDLLLVEPRYR